MAKANGIAPLIELVSTAPPATQQHAARCLWHLAGSSAVGAVASRTSSAVWVAIASLLRNKPAQAGSQRRQGAATLRNKPAGYRYARLTQTYALSVRPTYAYSARVAHKSG